MGMSAVSGMIDINLGNVGFGLLVIVFAAGFVAMGLTLDGVVLVYMLASDG